MQVEQYVGEKPYEVVCHIMDGSPVYMVKDENGKEKTLHRNKLLFLAPKAGDECHRDNSV